MDGYAKPFRKDRDKYGGGILIYVKEGIACKELKLQPYDERTEGICLEINLRKNKWLLFAGYNNYKMNISSFLNCIGPTLDHYMSSLERFILLGDFNSEVNENDLREFCDTYHLQNLVKEPTCFKNPANPSSIDVILTNKPLSFQNTTILESGLSDHHKLTATVLKTFVPKRAPYQIKYRDYRKFNDKGFKQELADKFNDISRNLCYNDFESNFIDTLNKYLPIKTKTVRFNNSPFMNKDLSKAIMTRFRLKNKYNKNPNDLNRYNYKRQRNYCVNLSKRVKKAYYSNIDVRKVNDNKKFWDTIKPFFSDKNISKKYISLIEKDTIITDDSSLADTFNSYFSSITNNISGEARCATGETLSIDDIIQKHKNHPSIISIMKHNKNENKFSFSLKSHDEIKETINGLNVKKPTTFKNIPAKVIKQYSDLCSKPLHILYNDSICKSTFPDPMKQADITPCHKKNDKCNKENYRPISILSSLSKIFEKKMYDDIYQFMLPKLSPYLCGFRKGYSTQYCLTVMIERFKKALDNRDKFGALLTDLSKAFDCLNHELLIAKLHSYGFDRAALKLVLSYLSNRKHRTKVNNEFSDWANILFGIPQGSILGPLLFNIYINDIFYFLQEDTIANFADDTTPYCTKSTYEELIGNLQIDCDILIDWFHQNFFKLNAEKCKLLISNKQDDISLVIKNEQITCEKSVKLLGIRIDNKLTFNEHITNICKKVSQKLHALARVSRYIDQEKLRLILKAFIESQFSYCSLIWMFHCRSLNNKINKLHERALRLVYKDKNLSFRELLEKDNSFTTHERNLQKLAIEMYKVINNESPTFMQAIFPTVEKTYDLRKNRTFKGENVRTTLYGTETLKYRGPKTWELVPHDIKMSANLWEFKRRIKNGNQRDANADYARYSSKILAISKPTTCKYFNFYVNIKSRAILIYIYLYPTVIL